MYCHQCGKEIPDFSKFCLSCGAQLEEAVGPPAKAQAAVHPVPLPERKRTVAASRPILSFLAGGVLACLLLLGQQFVLVFGNGVSPVVFAEKSFSVYTFLFLSYLFPLGMGLISLGLAIKLRGNFRCFMSAILVVSVVALSYRIYSFKKGIDPILFLAASLGHEQAIRDLASIGIPVAGEIEWPVCAYGHCEERSTTALYAALACDQFGIAQVLVEHGAGRKDLLALFVDSLDPLRVRTPFWQCVSPAKEQMPKLRSRYRMALLKSGVNVSSWVGSVNPLLMAVEDGDIETARWLTQHGADVNRQSRMYVGNPLEAAALAGNEPMVRMLLERDVDSKLIREAIEGAVRKGHTRIVNLLKSQL